jgi:hypothetical protein
MSEVKVINHNEETLRGRFDGEDYAFVPEKPTYLSLDAAKHIFGLGNEDKAQALNALGWFVPGGSTYEQALAKLDNISFLQGRTVFEDEEGALPSDETDDPPADEPRRGRKTGGRPHVNGPGGETAAGEQSPAAENPG